MDLPDVHRIWFLSINRFKESSVWNHVPSEVSESFIFEFKFCMVCEVIDVCCVCKHVQYFHIQFKIISDIDDKTTLTF